MARRETEWFRAQLEGGQENFAYLKALRTCFPNPAL